MSVGESVWRGGGVKREDKRGGPVQNAQSGIEMEIFSDAALRHSNLTVKVMGTVILAVSNCTFLCHHRWCCFLI